MDDTLKNRIVIVLAIVAGIFFFTTLASCNSALKQKAARDKELAARITLEEKMSKFSQEKSALEEKAKAREGENAELKTALEVAKKTQLQDELVSQSLKDELNKVTKLKDALEADLKEQASSRKNLKK